MAELSRQELHRLARLGAQARLEELRREEAAIRQAFPELFNKSTRPIALTSAGEGGGAAGAAPVGKRRGRKRAMSAAERKEVSLRMKKYWAARRKAKAAQADGAKPGKSAAGAKAAKSAKSA